MVEELAQPEFAQLLVDHPLPRLAAAVPRQVDRVDAVPDELDGVEHRAVQEHERFVLVSTAAYRHTGPSARSVTRRSRSRVLLWVVFELLGHAPQEQQMGVVRGGHARIRQRLQSPLD